MIRLPSASVLALLAALALAFALLPAFAGPYEVKFATRVLATAIFVLGLDLLIGVTGLVSFGHAAWFGLGAYAVWSVTPPDYEAASLPVALLAAVALPGAVAAVVGVFAVRTRAFYFIMVTLAASQMIFAFFHDTRVAGGSDGASIDVKPALIVAGRTVLDLANRDTLLWVALACLAAAYAFVLALARSRFGRVLQGLKGNETRMNALGFDGAKYKWASFVIAAMVAGLGGALYASIDGFVPPEILGWRESGLAIMMVVLGGVGSLWGAILGALVYALAEEMLKSADLVGATVADHWPIAMGVLLIAAVLGAPKGLAGWMPRRPARPWSPPAEAGPSVAAPARPPRLEVDGLRRTFGGLTAVDGVAVAFEPARIHAVIGPNGAGKTTFTNLLSGALPVSGGRILLDGVDVTALSAPAKARRGIGRSFQRTNVLPAFTVAENCELAAQARGFAGAGRAAEARAVAEALVATGLVDRADRPAAELSHGEQRQLEIAMLIASGARLLILDEPLAGSGPEETARLTALLKELAVDHTILLIEHDMDAVFACADTVSVLVGGRLLAHGAPDEIRRDAAVREAYLGRFAGLEDAA